MNMKLLLFIGCWVIVVALVWGVIYFTDPFTVRARKITKHQYYVPDILKGNAEYLSLIEDWRSVEKMDSWTSEHSLAEDRLKRKFRQFLIKDLSKTENVLDIPIVAIALQSTRILIEHHHTSVESLDWDLASFSRLQIMHIMSKDLTAEQIEAIVWRILRVEDVIDDEGVDAALEALSALQTEFSVQKTIEHGDYKGVKQ